MLQPSFGLTGLFRPGLPVSDREIGGGRTSFSFAGFSLEADGTLFRGQTQVHLPPKELAALRLLIAHAGQIVTLKQLKQALWGDVHVTPDSITKCLSSLRARLEPEECIQTVYKRGYRLTAEVKSREPAPVASLPRLAIAPFTAGYGVPEYLGPSIAEETTAHLTRDLPSVVSMLARDSVFTLALRGLTARQIGQTLHADFVLTGTLRALPAHFRLRVEMIRVEDGAQIWVEDMLVERGRIAGLESELADRLTFRLRTWASGDLFRPTGVNNEGLSLSAGAASDETPETESNRREAYEIYLRARYEWRTLQRHRMQDSLKELARAIELDPGLIEAKVDLVHLCVGQAFHGFLPPVDCARLVRSTAQSVPELSVQEAGILPALGWVNLHFDRNLSEAIKAFSVSARRLNSPYFTGVWVLFLLSRHRFAEAISFLRDSIQDDPCSPWLNYRLAWALHLDGQASESLKQILHCVDRFPEHDGTGFYASMILPFNGEVERGVELAQEHARSLPYSDLAMAVHAYALARAGRADEARAILERLQWLSRERFVPRSFTPAVHVALGDHDAALAELRVSDETRCPWFLQMLADPRLKPLHGRPEFEKLRAILTTMEAAAAERQPEP
jgi:DNA-binding winged helix-turn-helix (wHTH) protein